MIKIRELTRTELFFTSTFHHVANTQPEKTMSLFQAAFSRPESKLDENTSIIDSCFEVCFFRDFAKANIIDLSKIDLEKINSDRQEKFKLENNSAKKKKPRKITIASLKKQTFDNIFILSSGKSERSIIIVEAKANQKFSTEQLDMLEIAKDTISSISDFENVYLVGLYSSKYSPKDDTKEYFDAVISWEEIATKFGDELGVFKRANDIYND